MIRGKYEAYSGHSHLSADRQGRQMLLFPKAIDDYIPPRRQAGLPAGRLEVSFRAIADFKLVDKMEKFGYQKIKERL